MPEVPSPTVTVTLRAKLLLLLLTIGGLAALAVFIWNRAQAAQYNELFALQQAEGVRNLSKFISLRRASLRAFAADYAHWDEMAATIAAPRPNWGNIFTEASLQNFDIDVVAVLGPDLRPLYSNLPMDLLPRRLIERAPQAVEPGQTPFFLDTPDGLVEWCLEPVRPHTGTSSADPPAGWLAVGRLWNHDSLSDLVAPPFATPRIIPPGQPLPTPSPSEARMVALLPLPSPDGNPAAYLAAEHVSPLFLSLQRATRFQAQALTVVGSVLFLVLLLSLQFWVVGPLQRLTRAVQTETTDGLEPLLSQQSEFGVLARLLAGHFSQARTLTREMNARLSAQDQIITLNHEKELIAREIHDNVVQSLYGIGLRLASARKALADSPEKARSSLEASIRDVDQAMHNLRLFLNSLGDQTGPTDQTWQAIRSILSRMHETGLLDVETDIDRDGLASLSPVQGFHLVRIINEACTNVLKHADASEIRIEFQARPGGFHLLIADDGCGLPPDCQPGYGLGNMQRRAEELGGTFKIETHPGQGTRILVEIPRDPSYDQTTPQ